MKAHLAASKAMGARAQEGSTTKDHSSQRVGVKYPAVVKNGSLLNDIGWGSRKVPRNWAQKTEAT